MELSVRFFKRLILAVLALMIVVPVVLAVWFGSSAHALRAENLQLEDQLTKVQAQLTDRLVPEPETEGRLQEDLAYQGLYPELYSDAAEPETWAPVDRAVYLTFDDGPSSNTRAILDTLDEQGVKAAFFVSGRSDGPETRELLKEIADRGHTLGVLSSSNDYRTLYATVENYLEDFNGTYQMIYEATGVKPAVFRFPGGSVNSYNTRIYRQLIAEMLRRGFVFYDWNVTGVDTVRGATADSVVQAVLSDMTDKQRAIVELHDRSGNTCTVEALPTIIRELKARGYTLEPLTHEVFPIVFSYELYY